METFIDVEGARLFVRAEGSGRAIVLAHAGVVDQRSWDGVAPGLLEGGYRVVRYDARGYGRSVTDDVEFATQDDLFAVMDALDIDRAALVGNSMGAHAALQAALVAPRRVAGVVAVGAALGGFEAVQSTAERRLWEEGERLEKADVFDADAYADVLVRVFADGPGQPPDRVGPEVREAVRSVSRLVYASDHRRGRRRAFAPSVEERLGELVCPVLAVVGKLDDSACRATARGIAEGAPGARLEVLDGVAHIVPMEAPAALTSLILDFLRDLPPW